MNVFRGVEPSGDVMLAPTAIKVQVLNGSGRPGEAGATSEALAQFGFQLAGPGDARGTERTTIYYGTGQLEKAQLLERWLDAGADIVEDPSIEGVDVRLITGEDFTEVLPFPREEDESPATTSAPLPTTSTTAPLAPDC
jgi:hypothetical protein